MSHTTPGGRPAGRVASQSSPHPLATLRGDMAETWVATDDVAGNSLPSVCLRTGTETDERARLRGLVLPPWAPVGAVLAVLPLVVISATGQEPVQGAVPLRHPAAYRQRQLALVRNAALAIGVVALALQVVIPQVILLAIGVIGLLIAVVWTVLLASVAIGGQLDDTGDWVQLRGAHPAFAAASDAVYEEE